MKLLKTVLTTEALDDDTKMPEGTVVHIQKLITKGAKDLAQKWSNALHLVHKAYEVAQIQRPTPTMRGAWKQYESLIQYAVEWLSKTRGIKGDWRMSSAMFHEATIPNKRYIVNLFAYGKRQEFILETSSIGLAIRQLREHLNEKSLEVSAKVSGSGVKLEFHQYGIKRKLYARIRELH